MKLFHTSPNAVIEPRTNGRFGAFLFFSASVYTMTAGEYSVFTTEVDDSRIIEAGSLWYADNWEAARAQIEACMELCGVDEDTAMELLDESASVYDLDADIEPEDMADVSWNIQRLTAECAKALGYIGVEVEDEQGTAYMLDVTAITLTK